jgi:hypothetical protein
MALLSHALIVARHLAQHASDQGLKVKGLKGTPASFLVLMDSRPQGNIRAFNVNQALVPVLLQH